MAFSDNALRFKIDSNAAKCIDDYFEYTRIVGDDDGGTLFTPKQYNEYKEKVLSARINNRLFVSWASVAKGIECKIVGPETKCFCTHRYKQHKTDFDVLPTPIKLPCNAPDCNCKSYSYVPLNGTQPIRCTCKHFADEHSFVGAKKCKKPGCTCKKFHSAFTCGCGEPTYNHQMIVETKAERVTRGKPVGHDVLYKAMGGITGFSSLADGYLRLDDSGVGAPSKEFFEQPAGPFDHPFLKIHSNMQELGLDDKNNNDASLQMTQEEKDMAYFEKRYQQRLKQERLQARAKTNPKALPSKQTLYGSSGTNAMSTMSNPQSRGKKHVTQELLSKQNRQKR
ncbi:protein FAM221A-like [Hydractinia symbiolongicarpus]|uniref:protein FAM221A-like n=1 Tax=Hydractinia symbiolongicarpus TaxID=13093 RepID=UPI0025519C4E|nr:protein FAM221A-like [Hydractinia symbiolongicarpus]